MSLFDQMLASEEVFRLVMPSEDVAIALGHQDGGNLVRRLYGHRDTNRALDRIVGAYAAHTHSESVAPPSGDQAVQSSLF